MVKHFKKQDIDKIIASLTVVPAYIGIADMGMFEQLKELSVKVNYYFEQHKKRWVRRYKQSYPDSDGELGIFEGFRWINGY